MNAYIPVYCVTCLDGSFLMPDSDFRATNRIGRRPLIHGAGVGALGLAAAALLGCGGDEDEATPAATPAEASSPAASGSVGMLVQGEGLPFPYQYPDPPGTPKPGGIFKFSTTYDV